ncbi:MAG: hypothetical protein D6679_12520 [Candidatus Hydrogenedentota bacterium]|nr:MAG: hypothetical protein D6679_12520 [Candidatus Hydrogenedentota bacterium]
MRKSASLISMRPGLLLALGLLVFLNATTVRAESGGQDSLRMIERYLTWELNRYRELSRRFGVICQGPAKPFEDSTLSGIRVAKILRKEPESKRDGTKSRSGKEKAFSGEENNDTSEERLVERLKKRIRELEEEVARLRKAAPRASDSSREESDRGRRGKGERVRDTERIDFNEASFEQLRLVPEIGDTGARAIVWYREHFGRFERREDLLRVPGFSPERVRRLERYWKPVKSLLEKGGEK